MGSKIKAKKKQQKRNALVMSHQGREFWTTQAQFWEWVRNGIVVKVQDGPLTGTFIREHEETLVVLQNTLLNLAHPNHLREALASRRAGLTSK